MIDWGDLAQGDRASDHEAKGPEHLRPSSPAGCGRTRLPSGLISLRGYKAQPEPQVPAARLNRLRKDLLCIRARLQSCRKRMKIGLGFSPCALFTRRRGSLGRVRPWKGFTGCAKENAGAKSPTSLGHCRHDRSRALIQSELVETVGSISLEFLPFRRDLQNWVMSSEQPCWR